MNQKWFYDRKTNFELEKIKSEKIKSKINLDK